MESPWLADREALNDLLLVWRQPGHLHANVICRLAANQQTETANPRWQN